KHGAHRDIAHEELDARSSSAPAITSDSAEPRTSSSTATRARSRARPPSLPFFPGATQARAAHQTHAYQEFLHPSHSTAARKQATCLPSTRCFCLELAQGVRM